jgi:glycosyltransferase involved in cell wall biosynthesis
LAERAHFLGWRNDVPTILCDIDLLVHTARQEPLGRVLLEASALKCPIVATSVGGTPEIVADGETGWLIPPDDSNAAAERIAWVIEHPEAMGQAGIAARRSAGQKFSINTCADRIEDLYKQFC